MTGSESITIALGRTLDVSVCEAIHLQLREALRTAHRIVLDAAGALEIDVTFLQILAAAQRSAERAGKTIDFAQPPEGVLAETLWRCGFAPPAKATSLREVLSL